MWNGRRRRCGSAQSGDVEVVARRGRPSSGRARGRRACPGSRSGRRARPILHRGSIAAGMRQGVVLHRSSRSSRSSPAAAATTRRRRARAPRRRELRQGRAAARQRGHAHVGTDNPAYPPWFGGGAKKGSTWKINDPSTGKGFESRGRLRGREAARLRDARGEVGRTCRSTSRIAPGQEVVRLRHQPDLVHAGAREGRRLQLVVLRRQPGDRRAQGDADRERDARSPACGLQARRAARHDELRLHHATRSSRRSSRPSTTQNAAAISALKNEADRRPRRRPADGVLRDRRAGAELEDPRPVPDGRRRGEHFGMVFAKGNPLAGCVEQRARAR